MNNHKQNKGYILTGVAVHCKINTSLSVNCQEVWNKDILQWITLCKMKHLTKIIWKLECRSWPVFVCQLEAVQQKLDSQETDIFFLTDWQAADNQELIISLTNHFTETEIQNTTKPPWLNGHPFLPLCPNLSYFLPFIIICAEYSYFFACHAMLRGKTNDRSRSSLTGDIKCPWETGNA